MQLTIILICSSGPSSVGSVGMFVRRVNWLSRKLDGKATNGAVPPIVMEVSY